MSQPNGKPPKKGRNVQVFKCPKPKLEVSQQSQFVATTAKVVQDFASRWDSLHSRTTAASTEAVDYSGANHVSGSEARVLDWVNNPKEADIPATGGRSVGHGQTESIATAESRDTEEPFYDAAKSSPSKNTTDPSTSTVHSEENTTCRKDDGLAENHNLRNQILLKSANTKLSDHSSSQIHTVVVPTEPSKPPTRDITNTKGVPKSSHYSKHSGSKQTNGKPNMKEIVCEQEEQAMNPWASKKHPWAQQAEELKIQSASQLHAQRGPCPAKFGKMVHDPDLQRKLNAQHTLPSMSEQLEMMLPQELRNIAMPKFGMERTKLAEERKKVDEERNKDVKNSNNAEAALRKKTKANVKPKDDMKAKDDVKADKGPKADQKLSTTKNTVAVAQEDHKLTSSRMNEIPGAGNRQIQSPSSDGSIAGGGSLKTHGGKKNSSAKNLPRGNGNTLSSYQDRSAAILVEERKEYQGLGDEIAAYNREDHGGEPSEISDNDSLLADNLSEFSDNPEGTIVEEFYRWKWFTKDIESIASASDYEESLHGGLHCELSEWDGNYQPPLASMPGEMDLHWSSATSPVIHKWLNGIVFTTHKRPFSVDTSTETFRCGVENVSGMRRRYIEHPPDSFFKFSEPSFAPVDWSQIPTFPSPDAFSKAPYRREQTAHLCAKVRKMDLFQEVQERKRLMEQLRREEAINPKEKPQREHNLNRAITKDNPWVPKANIYVRPATIDDMPKVAAIHGRWIDNSIQATELLRQSLEYYQCIFYDQADRGHPFLVAVEKHTKSVPKSQREANILGCAWTECYGSPKTSTQNLTDIQIWVDQDRLHEGIGKSLMDRMMPCLDELFIPHCGTDFRAPPGEEKFYYRGGRDPMKKVVVTIFYESNDKSDWHWKKKYFEEMWGFHVCGFFMNAAYKFRRPINMVVMMRECMTGEGNASLLYPGQPANAVGLITGI